MKDLIDEKTGKKRRIHVEEFTKEIEKAGIDEKLKNTLKRDRKVAAGISWLNILTLSAFLGLTLPALINRMIRADVAKDAQKHKNSQKDFKLTDNPVFKNFV